MAYQDVHFASSREVVNGIIDGIARFFESIGQSIVLSSEAHRRLHRVEELREKSDAELAELNIRRDDIVREVFGDLFYS